MGYELSDEMRAQVLAITDAARELIVDATRTNCVLPMSVSDKLFKLSAALNASHQRDGLLERLDDPLHRR